LNIRDLQYLVAVHETSNFSKAAEKCFVSQPTLSGQLKKLEESLGAKLMERSTRKVLFTQLGEKVVEQARNVLMTVDNISDLARQSDNPFAGDYHVGLIPTVAPFLLPLIMPSMSSAFPNMNLFLHELQTDSLVDKLLKGEIDAAILAKLDWDYPVREFPLYEETFNLAMSDKDPIATRGQPVSLSVLEDRSVLMLEDGHCLRDQALGVCFSAGAKEDQRFKATSMETLLHMVATGTGMTLIPELACQKDLAGINYLPFIDPKPSREVVMLARNNSSRMPALEQVRSTISNAIAPVLSKTHLVGQVA